MMELKELTNKVCEVARMAGAYLREERLRFDESVVEQKHAHDYVSYVDKSSEAMIVRALKELLPEAGFLTEEGLAGRDEEDCWWVIDPLDGTTNYVHGNTPYAVSIALRNANEVMLGVVYEVAADECFYAWQGGGAYLNGAPISVNRTHSIEQALLGLELPYDANAYAEMWRRLIGHFYGYAGGVRMNGSAAVALCMVACGRWDGWIERFIGQWDYMAGMLIVREAGGIVTNFAGSEQCLNGDDIVASNGIIQQDLLSQTSL
ncbi:MAG: inositol monophosphatase [Bacteroidales bacterium]|nr:inositol monophosphatase [Bacteroidales bacterium]